MNLHQIVSGVIGSVNPNLPVTVQISTGYTIAADFSQVPQYATPGSITGSISGDVLTVATQASGVLQIGQTVAGAGVVAGTTITGLLSASGGPGTYQLNQTQPDIALEAMSTVLVALAQVQPLSFRDLQQIDGLNLQGTRKAIYLMGAIDGIIRPDGKGGDLVFLPDGSVYLVAMVSEGWNISAGWTKVICTLQDGA